MLQGGVGDDATRTGAHWNGCRHLPSLRGAATLPHTVGFTLLLVIPSYVCLPFLQGYG